MSDKFTEAINVLLEACYHVRNNLEREGKEVWEIEIAHLDHAIEKAEKVIKDDNESYDKGGGRDG